MPKPKQQIRPPRNWLAVLAHQRKAGAMKDRRDERRGARSWRTHLSVVDPARKDRS